MPYYYSRVLSYRHTFSIVYFSIASVALVVSRADSSSLRNGLGWPTNFNGLLLHILVLCTSESVVSWKAGSIRQYHVSRLNLRYWIINKCSIREIVRPGNTIKLLLFLLRCHCLRCGGFANTLLNRNFA